MRVHMGLEIQILIQLLLLVSSKFHMFTESNIEAHHKLDRLR